LIVLQVAVRASAREVHATYMCSSCKHRPLTVAGNILHGLTKVPSGGCWQHFRRLSEGDIEYLIQALGAVPAAAVAGVELKFDQVGSY
jgi:hypothetical protein